MSREIKCLRGIIIPVMMPLRLHFYCVASIHRMLFVGVGQSFPTGAHILQTSGFAWELAHIFVRPGFVLLGLVDCRLVSLTSKILH